ncbi:hypothetical protein [Xenorhabdus sp. PB62.4]|uniref:hypothetical protein n=1 Tax=Xenorhabdus sp. PB62.4 TaxID=1851573 RepID=UPI001656AD8A|nr:hypothetical protein [Xenorhabdus sp. PB62.4]MBC8954195.1 hypothetical protein [Xenorhabdus sp. PB62.4]
MIEILDVWGEGRIVDGNCSSVFCPGTIITGFPNSVNINKYDQKISNGPNRGMDIPNLSPVDDYINPKFAIESGSCKYITLMGSPLSRGTAEEILRVFSEEQGFGNIFFYDLYYVSLQMFIGMARDNFVIHDGRYKPAELKHPFNEITASAVDVFLREYTC